MTSDKTGLYNTLFANDQLAPIERLDKLIQELSFDREVLEIILLTLEAMDNVVTELLVTGILDSSRNFYIFQDSSVQTLIENALESNISHEQFVKSLILLNETDLIFRFTAARKFKIADASMKQLRINSWGKLYLSEKKLVDQYNSQYKMLVNKMRKYILKDQDLYTELVRKLSQPIQPESARRIAELNAELVITLLS